MAVVLEEDTFDYFCDHTDPQVIALSEDLLIQAATVVHTTSNTNLETEYAKLAHRWVRDNIKYQIQTDWSVPVSTTLERGHGDCGTKSCLLVALLRAVGIEAAFGVERIDTKDWFIMVPTSITEKCKSKSIHFTVSVKVNNEWYRLDPSPDTPIAIGVSGVCGDAFRNDFDGRSDAIPAARSPAKVARVHSICDYMVKKSRVPDSVRECFNLSVEHCRHAGRFFGNKADMAKDTELYLRTHHAAVFQDACDVMSNKQNQQQDQRKKFGALGRPVRPKRYLSTSPRQNWISHDNGGPAMQQRSMCTISSRSRMQTSLRMTSKLSNHIQMKRKAPLLAGALAVLTVLQYKP